jgi:hypothetical protein
MLMSDSLGGNAKTLVFVNVSPTESNLEESYNSIMYVLALYDHLNFCFQPFNLYCWMLSILYRMDTYC